MFRSHLGLLASLALVTLTACTTSNRLVILQHSETGQSVECREEPWADQTSAKQSEECVSSYYITCRVEPRGHVNRKRKLEACIAGYVRDGYEIVQDSQAKEK